VRSSIETRKVLGAVFLTIVWILCFIFIKPTLYVDWLDNGSITTPLPVMTLIIGLLVLVLYHIYYRSSTETTKLSLTSVITIIWLSLIIFYPYKDPNNTAAGAVGFFTLVGGLAVCVLWVHFFSDEIVA
jgi:hypothetical protein